MRQFRQQFFYSGVVALVLWGLVGRGQTEPMIYQLTGVVLDKATNEPIPFAVLQVNYSRRRAICNQNGFFSIPVIATDTLHFYSLAYFRNSMAVGRVLEESGGDTTEQYLYFTHYMIQDEISTPEIEIRPYRTREEIRVAMAAMPLDENSPAAAAARNVSPEMLTYLVENLPVDGFERQAAATQQYYLQYQYQNRVATVGLIDPIAIYRLVNYFSEKNRSRKDKKTYNYWPDDEN